MKKLLTFLLFITLSVPAWAAIQWRNGTAENVLDGTSAANLIGYNSYNKIVKPLDNLLSGYCTEYLTYNNSSSITVKAGACVVTGGSVRMFMLDPSDTNLTTANLDTGASFTPSTTYYVYASSPNATTQTSTYYISLSSTAPSGVTYYKRLGSFYSDASSQITQIVNDGNYYAPGYGAWTTKTSGATYQAFTDGTVTAYNSLNGAFVQMFGYTDSSSTPTTLRAGGGPPSDQSFSITFPVKKLDYYKVTGADVVYWLPQGN